MVNLCYLMLLSTHKDNTDILSCRYGERVSERLPILTSVLQFVLHMCENAALERKQ